MTSLTIGNCGFGFAPLRPQDAERAMLALSRNESIPLEPMKVSMKVDWETFPQYMERLSRMPLGVNISHLYPIAPAVAYVMGGFDEGKKRFPNDKEMQTIVRQFHEAMDAGAVGWSAQRLVPESRVSVQRDYDGTPMITDILPDEFYLALARALGDEGRGCIQFTQSGSKHGSFGIEDDFRFLESLAAESGRPLLYNAIAISDKFPESHRAQLKWLTEANARGVRVFGQAVTARAPVRMTLEDWNLFDSVPAWCEATVGTLEEKKAKLSNPALRQAMREEYDGGGMETLDFLFGELPKFIARKVHRKELMDAPFTLPGVSDGGAHIKFITPAIYPTETLAWLVRDTGVMTLEEAHFRLSGLCAWAAQFKDRGTLREGMAADMVIYDLAKLKSLPEEITYDLPANEWRRVQKAEGYRWIMVNGGVIFEDGTCTGTTPGKLLRHGQAV